MIRDIDASSGGAGMPEFTNLKGVTAQLDIQNVDTDMIIPKEYLKTIKKTGLGFAAFAELRYQNPVEVAKAGTPDGVAVEVDDFVLNRPEYRERAGRDGVGTRILVAGDNVGCGSSREHAPWSINGMGIRASSPPFRASSLQLHEERHAPRARAQFGAQLSARTIHAVRRRPPAPPAGDAAARAGARAPPGC